MIATLLIEENPTITFINEVKTIISEAITNAIVHGYKNEEDKSIDLKIVMNKECLAVDIIDKGVGIEDLEKAREPLYTTLDSEERSGLGFTIMELFSDHFEVNSSLNEGTHIYFEKKW